MLINRVIIIYYYVHMRRSLNSFSNQFINMFILNLESRTAFDIDEINVLDSHELFVLDDNEKKAIETIDIRKFTIINFQMTIATIQLSAALTDFRYFIYFYLHI